MITIHTQDHPPRGETFVNGHKVWACANEPGETLNDVLRHIAGTLGVVFGPSPDTPIRVKHIGCPAAAPVPLSRLGLDGDPAEAPRVLGRTALELAAENIARRFYRGEYSARDLTAMKGDILEALRLARAAGV